ncbi:MAG: hypothetical protein LC122_13595 [Chitinophagales bacterium]|nr:hypothetical protein [Chitinophagales bacterium]
MNNAAKLATVLAAIVSFRKMVDEQTKECRVKVYRADDSYAKIRHSLLDTFEPMTDEAGIGFDNLDCAIEVVADRMTDGSLDYVEREAWAHINSLIVSPRLRVAYDKRKAARKMLNDVERGIYAANRGFIQCLVEKTSGILDIARMAQELEAGTLPLTSFLSCVMSTIEHRLAEKGDQL